MSYRRKKLIFLGVLLFLFSLLFFFFSVQQKPLEKPDILKDEKEIDKRVELTDEDFEKNLKINLISIQEVPYKNYYFPTGKFVVGAKPKNTVIALSTEGVVGLSSYIEKVWLFRKESPIPTDYSGYVQKDGNLILLLGTEGKLDLSDLSLHITVQSLNSKEKREIIKLLPKEKIIPKGLKEVHMGDIFLASEKSAWMKLTKISKTVKKENSYSRAYRFLSFGEEDSIDFSSFSLKNKFTGKPVEDVEIRSFYEKEGIKTVYNGESHIPLIKTIEIIVKNKTAMEAEEILDNSFLMYQDVKISLTK